LSQPPSSSRPARYAVVGGGISGLTAAYRLSQLRPTATVEVFEGSARLGGVLHTNRAEDLLIERGADSFFNKLPWAADLCDELGLAEELIPTNKGERRAFVLRAGKLVPVPEGFVVIRANAVGPILKTPLLSWRGKLRLLGERWVPRAQDIDTADYDESVASFATRRLGRETFERLVQPLLAGIYTADPAKLSLAATMPEVIEDERKYGSLHQASLAAPAGPDAQASGARYARFVTLRRGLQQLVDKLSSQLAPDSLHLQTPIRGLHRDDDGSWLLIGSDGKQYGPFAGIIIGLPAPRAAELVAESHPELEGLLQKIPYASSAVVSLAFSRDQITQGVAGFGFVVPTVENRKIVAASFSSQKFPGRAPVDQHLIRVFLGGAKQPEVLLLPDDQLCELARTEISAILNIQGEPSQVDLVRWQEKMPQYHLGHPQLVAAIENLVEKLPALELAGNAYHGVGIPQCVHSGNLAAQRLVATSPR
jgi:oxygen-dependent protoporphyrinogen oxidase